MADDQSPAPSDWEPGVWYPVDSLNENTPVPPKGTWCIVDFGEDFEDLTIRNNIFEERDSPSRRFHAAISDGNSGFTMPVAAFACDATDDGDGILIDGYMLDRFMILPP